MKNVFAMILGVFLFVGVANAGEATRCEKAFEKLVCTCETTATQALIVLQNAVGQYPLICGEEPGCNDENEDSDSDSDTDND